MSEYKLLINGELVDGAGQSIDVINPATEAPVAKLQVASESQLIADHVKTVLLGIGQALVFMLEHRG